MDFISDALFDGRRFRAFTLVEKFSRECIAIRPAPKVFGPDVAEFLDEVVETHGKPERIYLYDDPEIISKALALWTYQAGVTLDFSRPGKPGWFTVNNGNIGQYARTRAVSKSP